MKVCAIQNYGTSYSTPVKNRRVNSKLPTTTQPSYDTVSFKNRASKGFGICALLGAVTAIVISGGAATPLAIGVMAGATGTAGGMLGGAVDKVMQEDK